MWHDDRLLLLALACFALALAGLASMFVTHGFGGN